MEDQMDKGWAWVILVVTLLSRINSACLMYSIGVLNVALLDTFDRPFATTAIAGSVFLFVLFCIGPIASIIINTFGCRVAHIIGGSLACIGFGSGFFVDKLELIMLTYGVLGGAGIGICFTNATVILSFYFKKYLGLCFGIAQAGSGLGVFISGPFCQYLIDTYSLNGTYLLMGGLVLNEVVFGSLMFPTRAQTLQKLDRNKERQCDTLKKIFQFQILTNKTYVVILICEFVWTMSYASTLFHLPNFAIKQGSTPEQGALLITALGIGSCINGLLTGLVIGPGGIDPFLIYLGFTGILGGITLTFPLYFVTHVPHLVYSLLFGIYTGGLMVLKNPLCMDIVGLQYISTAIGHVYLLNGLACISGPPVTGLIADITGSYEYGFYLSGVQFVITFFLLLIASLWRKDDTRKQLKPASDEELENELEPL